MHAQWSQTYQVRESGVKCLHNCKHFLNTQKSSKSIIPQVPVSTNGIRSNLFNLDFKPYNLLKIFLYALCIYLFLPSSLRGVFRRRFPFLLTVSASMLIISQKLMFCNFMKIVRMLKLLHVGLQDQCIGSMTSSWYVINGCESGLA